LACSFGFSSTFGLAAAAVAAAAAAQQSQSHKPAPAPFPQRGRHDDLRNERGWGADLNPFFDAIDGDLVPAQVQRLQTFQSGQILRPLRTNNRSGSETGAQQGPRADDSGSWSAIEFTR